MRSFVPVAFLILLTLAFLGILAELIMRIRLTRLDQKRKAVVGDVVAMMSPMRIRNFFQAPTCRSLDILHFGLSS
jgi:hypothetical protein